MTQRETLAAIKAIKGMTATVRDGEYRVTMTLDAISGRYAGTRQQAIARAEQMACYTNDPADAIASARDMSFRFFATPQDYARRNAEAARQRALDTSPDNRNAFNPDKPFRAFAHTPVSKFNFDFATLADAREYIADQLARADGRIAAGRAPAGPRFIDPMESFIIWADGVETLADSPWNFAPPSDDRFGEWVAVEPAPPATEEIRVVGTVDLTPTWAAVAPIFIMALEAGTETGRTAARLEVRRMATLADERNDMAETLERLRQESDSCDADVKGFASTSGLAGWPAINRRDDFRKRVREILSGDNAKPEPSPLDDPNAIQSYGLKAHGCNAAGAVVLRRLPGNEVTPFVVHFRNDPDSVNAGRPVYYFGDYCRTLAEAWEAFGARVLKYDPDGSRAA